jgi:hypothetical protein
MTEGIFYTITSAAALTFFVLAIVELIIAIRSAAKAESKRAGGC